MQTRQIKYAILKNGNTQIEVCTRYLAWQLQLEIEQ